MSNYRVTNNTVLSLNYDLTNNTEQWVEVGKLGTTQQRKAAWANAVRKYGSPTTNQQRDEEVTFARFGGGKESFEKTETLYIHKIGNTYQYFPLK